MKAEEPGLLTDLYELTMAQAYYEHGMFAPATFSLFIRQYPPGRSFFVAASRTCSPTWKAGGFPASL